jgi:hypothetical protein
MRSAKFGERMAISGLHLVFMEIAPNLREVSRPFGEGL